MQILIDQMVTYVSFQAAKLDDFRLQMFLKWLKSHNSAVRNMELSYLEVEHPSEDNNGCLRSRLKSWFESLPLSGLIWEYQLILTEIRWWRTLDQRSLDRILKEDTED
jgi:hypothetical protein